MIGSIKPYARSALVITYIAAAASVVLNASAAAAHGPCYCLSPSKGTPSTLVKVPASYGAVEVLWNPNPRELGQPALVGSPWARFFHPDRRTISVARQPEPGPISFRVPNAPVGRYLVVIFDLSEGGPRNHYTWHTFAIQRRALLPTTASNVTTPLTVGSLTLALGGVTIRWTRRRPVTHASRTSARTSTTTPRRG